MQVLHGVILSQRSLNTDPDPVTKKDIIVKIVLTYDIGPVIN